MAPVLSFATSVFVPAPDQVTAVPPIVVGWPVVSNTTDVAFVTAIVPDAVAESVVSVVPIVSAIPLLKPSSDTLTAEAAIVGNKSGKFKINGLKPVDVLPPLSLSE